MILSRVTLAMIDAAATQAATRSPFQMASPGHAEPVDPEAVGQHVRRRHLEAQQSPA